MPTILFGTSKTLAAPALRSLVRPAQPISTYPAWVATHKVPLRNGRPVAALVYLAAVAIAYASLKFYNEPVRAWFKMREAEEKEQ